MTSGDQRGLVIEGLSKSYPGVTALDGVSLRVAPGTIHGLVGENGAGKSTLMKCVAGAIRADRGSVALDGVAIPGDVHAAAEAGVAMIYQELTIVPELSALDNVFLGSLPSRLGVLDRREGRRRYRAAAEQIGATTRPGTRAGGLSTSAQQQLEIMRALTRRRRLLIMDEPTASLGPEDAERLHAVIRGLRDQGMAVVYVSHDLDAVLDVCDSVTVLREGRVVETRPASSWRAAELVEAMVGDVALSSAGGSRERTAPRPLFDIAGLRAPGVDVPGLQIRSGEILGVAGLVGSGRTRFLRCLAGADPAWRGSLRGPGATATAWPRSPRQARRRGILLAPEDRKRQGLVLGRASGWNVALGAFGRAARSGTVTAGRIRRWAGPVAVSVGFDGRRLAAPAGTLSGGNQQKLLLARLLAQDASCILLDEPTRGIDVGAKAQIFDTIRGLVADGRAVVWSSSDLSEVAEHSDRIVVLAGGRLVAELPGGSSVREILDAAFTGSGAREPVTEGSAA